MTTLHVESAKPFEPAPLTRVGPGINGAIKPEFVDFAGNLSFQGYANVREVDLDRAMAIMSLGNDPTNQLFAFDNGTSMAAPAVARVGSILWDNLRKELGTDPQANLVRAILAYSADVPPPVTELLETEHGAAGIRKVCGYGMIDEDLAYTSADRRVTMFHEGSIQVDTFQIFEVPIVDEFRNASGKKRITVTLAFDPPVRRRRAQYLGLQMRYSLIRGKSLDEIIEAYRALEEEERKAYRETGEQPQGAFQGAAKCKLKPGSDTLATSTLQKSTWEFSKSKQEYGDSYYLIVRCDRRWAPETFSEQNFAVTVTLQANEPRLYNLIQMRVQNRIRQRQRERSRS